MNEEQKSTVLVVDDTPENIDVIVGLLKDHYKVRAATSGEKALANVAKAVPDLILLDIMMPEMDGYEVCKRLKADDKTKSIPVIFLTAMAEMEDEIKGLSLGAVDYITKPIKPPVVLSRVKTHLSLRRAQQLLVKKNRALHDTLEELKATQDQLVQSEKLAALGQLVAGIAHEINTPLGAIKSSIETIDTSLDSLISYMPEINGKLDTSEISLLVELIKQSSQLEPMSFSEKRKVAKALTAQLQEKGISLGSTEIKNLADFGLQNNMDHFLPLLGSSEKDLLLKTLSLFSNLRTGVNNITTASEKAAKIVFSLKTFAHFDHGGEKKETDVQQGLETVLTLYHNQIKQNVTLVEDYELLPKIMGYPDELTQVWTNLIHNSLQAMKNQGELRIKTEAREGAVVVSVSDNGPGIPEEIREKIFQPFFTTKGAGEGSGLGLDIVSKIIKKHNGLIELDTEIGVGTTFRVSLPIDQ